MKTLFTFLAFIILHVSLHAQCHYASNLQTDAIRSRALVAFPLSDSTVSVSWRMLTTDKKDKSFFVYRNNHLITPQPLTNGGCYFVDHYKANKYTTYILKDIQGNMLGSFNMKPYAPQGYLSIPLSAPTPGVSPDGRSYTYSANDASIGDLDGDGQYEIILKWEPSNAHDNSHYGYTGPTYLDALKLDGTRLWRINLGTNIRSGAHYTQFMVYDFDNDGKAELMCKTADGTIDGTGGVIGDANKNRLCYQDGRPADRPLSGPEFLTVFEGTTGKALKTVDYVPARGNIKDWGDAYGNRCDRFLAGVGYFDGKHPSALFCRGYYTRTVLAAWDWDGNELTSRWVFDTNMPGYEDYMGQGNHNLRIADVDGDGKDEVVYGAMTIDDNGKPLYNTHFGHGDALHLVPEPYTNRLFVWDCHENHVDGVELHDAATGKVVFQNKSKMDVGRCLAANIDPLNPGFELWSSADRNIYATDGRKVGRFDRRNWSINFSIYWDGDSLQELLDHEMVYKYDWNRKQLFTLFYFEGCTFNNWSKSNPCLSADFLGDWREEVVTRTKDNTELRIYLTPYPTEIRNPGLMLDIPYRLSVATQNVAYNQPSELSYYFPYKWK